MLILFDIHHKKNGDDINVVNYLNKIYFCENVRLCLQIKLVKK